MLKFQLSGSLKTLFKPTKTEDGESIPPAPSTGASAAENADADEDDDQESKDIKYVPVWEALPKEIWTKRNAHVPKHHDAGSRVGFWTKFNLMQRKEIKLMCRKKKIFFAQFILPILVILCFNFRAMLMRTETETTNFTPFVLSPVNMKHCNGTILLAPRFNESTIMGTLADFLNSETTASNFQFKEHPDMSQIGQSIRNTCGTVHFTDKEILDVYADTRNVANFVTIFLLPKKINYQIRLRAIQWSLLDISSEAAAVHAETSRWVTDRIYPRHVVIGPRNPNDNDGGEPGYASEGFLYLQHRIDMALISLIYNQEVTKPFKNEYYLELERFPFPAFESTNMLYLIRFELPFVLLTALLIQVLIWTYLAVKEKETGAKIFLHSFGISNFIQLLPFMIKAMIQYTLVNIVITFFISARWYEDGLTHVGLVDESSPLLIFTLLQVTSFNACTLSCLISVFFESATSAVYTAGFYWIFLNMPFLYFNLQNFIQNPTPIQYISSLFAQIGLRAAIQYISLSEKNVGGTHWEDLLRTGFDIGHILIMLLVGGIVNILLALYIENIRPTSHYRRHIAVQPKMYFFRRWWWKGQLPPDNHDAPEEDINGSTTRPEYFESEPKFFKPEYQIKGLSKCYVGDVGVFSITMNFYEGEISVILGAKGSGKSTLHHLMSGIIPPIRGSLLLNNVNVRLQPDYMKYNLGTCPQENFLCDYLTVEEHITLFSLLKGFRSIADAYDECEVLTKALKLKSICTHRACDLSYSQKRLVHIAIAFCAGSKVVILDEPTRNMDAANKRIVWRFLQKEKKKRTIIVLTSDTEEVNFISDRVAILVNGEIQCRGSLSFIKSRFGGGYTLKIFKGNRFHHFDVTKFVQDTVANSSVGLETDEFISYYLPGEYSFQFPTLLDHLETSTTRYDIENMTIAYVTMDEVFKTVCKMDESEAKLEFKRRKTVDRTPPDVDKNMKIGVQKEISICNFYHQFVYLLLKHMRVTWRRKLWLFLSYTISISILAIVCLVIEASPFDKNLPALPVNLDNLKEVMDPGFLIQCEEQYNGNNFCDTLNKVANRYAHVHDVEPIDINTKMEDLILRRHNKKNSIRVSSELVLAVNTAHGSSHGITTRLRVYFDNQALHIPPVAVNFASNLILTQTLTSTANVAKDYTIHTSNFPLEYHTIQTLGLAEDYASNGFYLGLAFTWTMTFFIPLLIVFPIREKYFKHIQFICGVNSILFWFTKILWDFILFDILIAFICLVLYCTNVFQFQHGNPLMSSDFQQLIKLLHAYGFAVIGLINCMAGAFGRSGVVGYCGTWLIFFFTGPFILSTLLITNEEDKDSTISTFMKNILEFFLIFPNCALGLGVFNIYTRYTFDLECNEEHREFVCSTTPNHGCCKQDPFFHHESGFGIGENLVALLAIGLSTHLLTLFMETDTCRLLRQWVRNSWIGKCCCCVKKKKKVLIVEEDPLQEIDFGDNGSEHNSDSSGTVAAAAAAVDDDKQYEIIISNIFHQSTEGRVLLDIPKLRLKKHECNCCFGLDGSGKSLLLQVVAGFVTPDMGDVKINGITLRKSYRKYINQISYSPDHPTLLPELTGSETLSLCAVLSRVPANKMQNIITALCLKLNLFNELENRVQDYSPGTLKKLALAIAMINNPEILICEEPSRDVDQASRLQIIKALAELKKTSSILISTSDMELCEQLCDRVVVFGRTSGRIRCYGSPAYLKTTYCDNNMITATLIPDAPYTYYPGNVVELGWDYEKDPDPDKNSLHSAESVVSLYPPVRKPAKPSETSTERKSNLKAGTNIVAKDKVTFHPRSVDTQPSVTDLFQVFGGGGGGGKPTGSTPNVKDYIRSKGSIKSTNSEQQRSFSLFSSNKVNPSSEVIGRGSHGGRIPRLETRHGSGFSLRSLRSLAPKMPLFGSFFTKSSIDLPKYEYQSSSSASFTSATVMEHWQVELIPIINFIELQFPDAELINIYPCFVQYLLRTEVKLSDVFKKMAVARQYLDVEHFAIGSMSLEQFFVHYIEAQTYDQM